MNRFLFFMLPVIVIAALAAGLWVILDDSKSPSQVACTEEAMMCPDGSTVSRTGPNCEFAKCPEVGASEPTKMFVDSAKGIMFEYPESLGTKYISLVDWPPMIQVLDESFSCSVGGEDGARAGKTELKTINGRSYCVTTVVEGAAGSLYTQYAYAFGRDGKTVIFTFSTRASQCGNYDSLQKTECESEREHFAVDAVVGRIVSTFKLQ